MRSVDEEDEDSKMILGERDQAEFKGGSQAIAAQLNKLTNMIEKLSKAKGPLPVEEMSRKLQAISQDVDQQASVGSRAALSSQTSTSNKLSNSRDTSPRRTGDSSGDEFPVPAGNGTDPVDPVMNLGHLSLEDGRSR